MDHFLDNFRRFQLQKRVLHCLPNRALKYLLRSLGGAYEDIKIEKIFCQNCEIFPIRVGLFWDLSAGSSSLEEFLRLSKNSILLDIYHKIFNKFIGFKIPQIGFFPSESHLWLCYIIYVRYRKSWPLAFSKVFNCEMSPS